MNFWKQTTHVMSYFKEENFRGDKRLPSNFMAGFLEVSTEQNDGEESKSLLLMHDIRAETNFSSDVDNPLLCI